MVDTVNCKKNIIFILFHFIYKLKVSLLRNIANMSSYDMVGTEAIWTAMSILRGLSVFCNGARVEVSFFSSSQSAFFKRGRRGRDGSLDKVSKIDNMGQKVSIQKRAF